MAACIASTQSVALAQDGGGTLRAATIVSPGNNNALISQADGLAIKAQHVTYGWPFVGSDYVTPVNLAPSSGYIAYGPEILAQTQTCTPGCVTADITWEISAYYPGLGNSPYSGISYALQVSSDYAVWANVAETVQLSPSGQTFRWYCHASWPICWNDNALHNFWARMMVAAGSFGAGDTIVCQYTGKRSITMMY